MTCIAFRDGVLAADRLATDGYGVQIGTLTKIFRGPKNELYGVAGRLSDVASFIKAVTLSGPLDELSDTIEAIRVDQRGAALAGGKRPAFVYIEAPYYAIGSGAHLALGAMWKGAAAEEAVECAIALEGGCGGPVDVIRTYEQANQFRPDPALTGPSPVAPAHFGGPR